MVSAFIVNTDTVLGSSYPSASVTDWQLLHEHTYVAGKHLIILSVKFRLLHYPHCALTFQQCPQLYLSIDVFKPAHYNYHDVCITVTGLAQTERSGGILKMSTKPEDSTQSGKPIYSVQLIKTTESQLSVVSDVSTHHPHSSLVCRNMFNCTAWYSHHECTLLLLLLASAAAR